jgi:hypothetical protein
MSEKNTLLKEADEEFASLRGAVAGLDEAQMREVWCGVWGVREILAHMSGWHRELGPALERLARGERPIPDGVSYEDVDAWNARFAEAKRSWATADIAKELEASHADFMRAAQAVPEDRFVPGKTAYKIVDLNSRHHYQIHGQEIAAWRKSRGI